MKLNSGHTVIPSSGEEEKRQRQLMTGYPDGTFRLQPGGWLFPTGFTKFADTLYKFKYEPSDVVIMTFPKCGTTWTQEIVWTMRNSPDLDHPELGTAINTRVPFVDMDMFLEPEIFKENYKFFAESLNLPPSEIADGLSICSTRNIPKPRTIKTHLPLSLMPPNLLDTCKVIYVVRNPKDVCISYLHHHKLFKAQNFNGNFDQFFDLFLSDELLYSPFIPHVLEAWQKKDHPNMLFLHYEQMKENSKQEFCKINDFIGTNLTDEQINKIVDYTSFASMKSRSNIFPGKEKDSPFVNQDFFQKDGGFFRKGKSNEWKASFSEEQEKRMNEWISNTTKGTGFAFK